MKIYILTDNRVKKRGFLAEHGLSIFIENKNANILFDTGQSKVYSYNAERMGLDLNRADCIVLSHGHYDHCGGVIYFPKPVFPNIYVNEFAFGKRYAINPDEKSYREIGIPWALGDYERIRNSVVLTRKKKEIAPGITLCGGIPSTTDFEEVPKGFYKGSEKSKTVDSIDDEQMLVFDTDKGLSVFLGCSHKGVVNCLKYVLKLFPGRNIYMLVAGMHMGNASSQRIQMTIQYLIDLDIQKIVPLHCTGIFAISEMKRLLGDRCFVLCAGDSVDL